MSNLEIVFLVAAVVAPFFLGALASCAYSSIVARRRQPAKATSDGSMPRLPLPPKVPIFEEETDWPKAIPSQPPVDNNETRTSTIPPAPVIELPKVEGPDN